MSPDPSENTSVRQGFSSVQTLHNSLDVAVRALDNDLLERLGPIQLRMPPADSPALSFYGAVSWMYIAVYERGSVSFRFLIERAKALRMDPQYELNSFRDVVHALRTLFQHELDAKDRRDFFIISRASQWMAAECCAQERIGEHFWPMCQADWETVLLGFYAKAKDFFARCIAVVEHIDRDEAKEDTIREWAHRCTHSLPGHTFDQLIADAIPQLGLPPLDPTRVRNANIAKWNGQIQLLDDTADFLAEARRLVASTLLQEWQSYCPLNGDDIIKHLGIPPGPEVRFFVDRAREIWRSTHCSREELICTLREKSGSQF